MFTLPRGKFITTSLASPTNKPDSRIETSIQFVKGVGPKLASVFRSREIQTVWDLLHFFPRTYEDRTKLLKIADLKEEGQATLNVRVLSQRRIPIRRGNRPGRFILEVRCADDSGQMALKWFHIPRNLEQSLQPGVSLTVTGNIRFFMSRPEMVHPEINWSKPDQDSIHVGRIIPVYTEIEGLPNRLLRKVLWNAVHDFSKDLPEDLPLEFRKKHLLPKLSEAIRQIHFPEETLEQSDLDSKGAEDLLNFKTPAHARLIYEEFLKFQFLLLRQRLKLQKEKAIPYSTLASRKAVQDLQVSLPFKLTSGQTEALRDILSDLENAFPMNRLIQGDVGSGKTIVSFLAAAAVLSEGGQVALMAPTEILAEQHYKNVLKFLGTKIQVLLLTGRSTASEREKIQAILTSGQPTLVIGTHALIEEPIQFKELGLILIDEQHRFGVDQRRALRNKGIRVLKDTTRVFPHVLVLTATPIPRTLALTAYGDLSVSSISELPPGRSPVITKICKTQRQLGQAYLFIREELKKGRQAYFIYPLVSESEAEGFSKLKSAEVEFERLSQEVFPEYKLGLLHGQLKSDEKSSVMDKFKKNEIQILVSTTVVEVGVDHPNATLMIIEHAERFGLSQLHQLRGRVGRGQHQSYCFLISHPNIGEISAHRLEVLEETQDGFKIAEADLEMRGPGEFLGTRQSGELPFKIASLIRDREWLGKAREDAVDLLKQDPELQQIEHAPLRSYFEREGKLQFERLKTS